MEKILIKTETINLDQLLKWASIVDSGGIVKFMIEDQLIKVNGEKKYILVILLKL